jgi:hypothetical protein
LQERSGWIDMGPNSLAVHSLSLRKGVADRVDAFFAF